jgi:hypothetical protein
MSIKETGYVQEMLLEPSLGTEHVRCRDLTWVKAERSDISGPGTGHVPRLSLELKN